MQSGDKAGLIGVLGVVFIIALTILVSQFGGRRAMTAMVEAGASPIAARCAVHGATNHEILCLEAMK